MKPFKYQGTDSEGQPVNGEIEAASEQQARDKLASRRITVEKLQGMGVPPTDKLTAIEAEEVASQISDLVASGLPIGEGLRAAAEELGPESWNPFKILLSLVTGRNERRIRTSLLRIARLIETGEPIDRVVETKRLPSELKALLQARIPSQRQAMAIGEYTVYSTTTSRLRGHVLFLFAYPLFALAAATSLVGVFFCFLVPQIKKVFLDFDTELPALTEIVFAFSDMAVRTGWVVVVLGPFLLALALSVFLASGSTLCRDLRRWIPLLGSSFRSLELAKTTHMLAVALRHQAPIPSALRAAGTGAESRNVATAFMELATTVEAGNEMPKSLPALRGLPLSFVKVAQDGSDRDTAADALHTLASIFERRSRVVMSLLAAIIQPIVIIGICGMIGLCFLSMFMPLIKLLNDLA